MWMTVGERRFAITLNDSAAARAFAAQLPLTLDMAELNGIEKYASLPKALPADPKRPGTIRNGDLMLYGIDTLVVFYLTFDSSYSYTRLGRVDDPADLGETLGRRGVRVVFSASASPTPFFRDGTHSPIVNNLAVRFAAQAAVPVPRRVSGAGAGPPRIECQARGPGGSIRRASNMRLALGVCPSTVGIRQLSRGVVIHE